MKIWMFSLNTQGLCYEEKFIHSRKKIVLNPTLPYERIQKRQHMDRVMEGVVTRISNVKYTIDAPTEQGNST